MAVKIKINVKGTWNDRRYGKPWIAVRRNGEMVFGRYDWYDRTLTIEAEPGDTIIFGQKDYRRPDRSIKGKMVAPNNDYEGALEIWGATNGTEREQVEALPGGELLNS